MTENMCLYKIKKAPHLAISSVYKEGRRKCIIEDTKGRLKKVKPLYVGPFDVDKLCKFGALTSRFYQKDNEISKETIFNKICELFNIDPSKVK